MKKFLLVLLLVVSLPSYAQTVKASFNAEITKRVVRAYVNGESYENVIVSLESSQQGYTTTYTSGILAGVSSVTYPWVKIKITDGKTNKKIYKKKIKKSCIFVFDGGTNIQIGQPDNLSLEGILKKRNGEWYLTFDETGNLD